MFSTDYSLLNVLVTFYLLHSDKLASEYIKYASQIV